MTNLYTSLFNLQDNFNHNQDDITLDIVNDIHGHADFNIISKYYDIPAYNNLMSHNPNKLNIIHLNSRSLPRNIEHITAFLNSLTVAPDILTITETWLNKFNKHFFQLPGYNSFHLIRPTRAHGGVTIYISENIHCEQLQEITISNNSIEINSVKLTDNASTYIICAIYRPYSKHEAVDEFTDILSTILQNNILKKNKTIIIGDLNINLLEHTTHAPTNHYLSTLQALNFFPHISRPTRFPDGSLLSAPSLLDHIYTNFSSNCNSGIIHYPVSDHLPIFLNLSLPNKTQKLHKISFRSMTKGNKETFANKIGAIDWSSLLTLDLNTNFNIFLEKLHEIYNESFPLKTKFICEKRLNNPWITQAVINSIRTKNNLYKDFKVGAVSKEHYRQYRNSLNTTIKHAKQSYYLNIFRNFKNNTKTIWNTINQLTNNNVRKNTEINNIIYKNNKLSNPLDIATAFNDFFTNIAHELHQHLPRSNTDPITFLRGNYPNSMVVLPVHPHDVVKIIDSLKNNKNTIEISTLTIKENKNTIAIPLSILFNQSINSGRFPQCLKHATIIPIHKKGAKDIVSNYRPISLLSCFSKIFEKLMKRSLLNFLESKNILNPRQFGFRAGRSTFTALQNFTDEIYTALDSQRSLLSIYIDFSKAFDTISHDILICKLRHYGIRGTINDWFKDYLTNRTQSTKLHTHTSTPLYTHFGVPQGSVLGPILFLIYINDISSIFKKLKTILFADDSTLYISDENPLNLIHTANLELLNLERWCASNKLIINTSKTFYMLFTNKPLNIIPPLLLNGNIINKTDTHTLLGITIDEKLTFKPHITNLTLKLSRVMSLLYRVKDFVPLNIMKMLYNAHVLPHFHYCTPIWCSTYPTHLLPIFRMQKRLIRIITDSDFYEHTQPLFKELNTLKLFDINKFEIAVYMFKLLKSENINLLQFSNHNYPTRARQNIRVPIHNLTIFQHSLSYLGPSIWNALPDEIKLLPTLYSFKKQLKKHIVKRY